MEEERKTFLRTATDKKHIIHCRTVKHLHLSSNFINVETL